MTSSVILCDMSSVILCDILCHPFDMQEIVNFCHSRGVLVLVDGAHALGSLSLDLRHVVLTEGEMRGGNGKGGGRGSGKGRGERRRRSGKGGEGVML